MQITRQVSVTGFEGVDVSGPLRVRVARGESCAASVSGGADLIDAVVAEINASTLTLCIRTRWSDELTCHQEPVEVHVALPDLVSLNVGGTAQAEVTGFDLAHDIRVHVSGASRTVAALKAEAATISVSGASALAMEGASRALIVDCSGASQVDLSRFMAEDVRAELSGASTARLVATERLEYSASGASLLQVDGTPRLRRAQLSGASSAQPCQAAQ